MFNFLLIDDQESKFKDIKRIFNVQKVNLDWISDYRKIKSITAKQYDLILLDMSYPNDSLGGVSVLNRLEFEKYQCPIIVITQYYNFDDLKTINESICIKNENYGKEVYELFDSEENIDTLPTLHKYLSKVFSNYFGCVLYSAYNTSWIKNLKILQTEITKDEDAING